MANAPASDWLAPVLWFVAAALAFIAAGIPFFDTDRKPDLSSAAAGLFCLVMGIALWRRRGQPPP